MHTFRRLLAVGAATVTVAGVATGGAGASPGGAIYHGGAFTATSPVKHTFTFAGAYTFECSSPSATGTGGFAGVSLTVSLSGCKYLAFPATVTTSGPWDFPLVTNLGGGRYANRLSWPSGTTTTISVPIAGCTIVIPGGQIISHGVAGAVLVSENKTGGVEMTNHVTGIAFTASGCPFSSGVYGEYEGRFFLPGVAIY